MSIKMIEEHSRHLFHFDRDSEEINVCSLTRTGRNSGIVN